MIRICFHGAESTGKSELARRLEARFGYPWVPLTFSFVALLFCISIVARRPWESLMGLLLLGAGLPFYRYWQRRNHARHGQAD